MTPTLPANPEALPPPPRRRAAVITPGIDAAAIAVYDGAAFVLRFFSEVVRPPYHFGEIGRQCYEIGVRSLTLITLTGFVIGAVFTKQSRPSLAVFGATSWLPSLITIAVIRALAPLVTALICAGKVGSSIGAELGSMKVTEQIEAMEVSAINPYKYLVVTRTIATTLMVPALALYCAFMALLGSYINVRGHEGTSIVGFVKSGFSSISFLDLWSSLLLCFLYGFSIGIISCYKGFNASSGTRGVGRAANASVVLAMFVIFIEEILIVQIINWIREF